MQTFPDPYNTVIDACAEIARCKTVPAISRYVETLPEKMRQDERISRAVKQRIAELRSARRSA